MKWEVRLDSLADWSWGVFVSAVSKNSDPPFNTHIYQLWSYHEVDSCLGSFNTASLHCPFVSPLLSQGPFWLPLCCPMHGRKAPCQNCTPLCLPQDSCLPWSLLNAAGGELRMLLVMLILSLPHPPFSFVCLSSSCCFVRLLDCELSMAVSFCP